MCYMIVMSFSMSALACKPHHTPGISALLALCFAKLALGRWHGFWHIMMADASTRRAKSLCRFAGVWVGLVLCMTTTTRMTMSMVTLALKPGGIYHREVKLGRRIDLSSSLPVKLHMHIVHFCGGAPASRHESQP
jgi:hypothetical protein